MMNKSITDRSKGNGPRSMSAVGPETNPRRIKEEKEKVRRDFLTRRGKNK